MRQMLGGLLDLEIQSPQRTNVTQQDGSMGGQADHALLGQLRE